ncbi:MAG: hypothetical protein N4A63_09650 [Vallitalea sp.]|jgi:hypothetical protein|nr:hypothetical protein [Vallitalea sp.]MCT4597684.1 hypothetical protein [Vallitalea sp.]
MYDPTLARFMQQDTYYGKTSDPLSLNRYTYCSNNPLVYWDYTGHWQTGDDKYPDWIQEKIRQATDDYYSAKDQGGRDDAHAKAIALRKQGNAVLRARQKNKIITNSTFHKEAKSKISNNQYFPKSKGEKTRETSISSISSSVGESLGNLKPCMNSSTTVSKKETNMFNKEKYNPHIREMVACVNPGIVQQSGHGKDGISNNSQHSINSMGMMGLMVGNTTLAPIPIDYSIFTKLLKATLRKANAIALGWWLFNELSIDAGGDLTEEQLEYIAQQKNPSEDIYIEGLPKVETESYKDNPIIQSFNNGRHSSKGNNKGKKGNSFRGGNKNSRDKWYGYDNKQFQRWWHRIGKKEYGDSDIMTSEMAKEVYDYWKSIGSPSVK